MLVEQLIAELLLENPKAQVIMQEDSEGNGYSPCEDIYGNCHYVAENVLTGDIYDLDYTAKEQEMSEEEWLVMKSNKNAVVLVPRR